MKKPAEDRNIFYLVFKTTIIKSIIDRLFSDTCILVKFNTDKFTSVIYYSFLIISHSFDVLIYILKVIFSDIVPNNEPINCSIIGSSDL